MPKVYLSFLDCGSMEHSRWKSIDVCTMEGEEELVSENGKREHMD